MPHRIVPNRCALLLTTGILLACRHGSSPDQDNSDDLKKRIEELTREVQRLRAELIRSRIENLDLKLKTIEDQPVERRKLLLREGVGAEYVEIQQYAVQQIMKLSPEQRKAAVPEILEKWKKSDEQFRVIAVSFLWSSGDEKAEETVLGASRDPSPDVRREVAKVLGTSTNDRAIAVLVQMLEDPQQDVRGAAVDALASPKKDRAVRPLLDFLGREKSVKLLEKAVLTLGEIASRDAIPALLELLSNLELRHACISSLGNIGDPRAILPLRPFLAAEEPGKIRQIAMRSLGRLKDIPSLPSMEKFLLEDGDPLLRQSAADAIGRMGEKASVERALLPAYGTETDDKARKEIWRSALGLSEKDFGLLGRVVAWLISKGLKTEIDEIGRRLAGIVGENGDARNIVAILEKICTYTFAEKLWPQSVEHHKALLKYAPLHWEAHRRMARCYLEWGDPESAIRTLHEAAEKARGEKAVYWAMGEDILAALEKLKDPARSVEETFFLLTGGPEAPPEPLKTTAQTRYDASAGEIVNHLRSSDEAVRKKWVEIARRLGKRIIRPVAAALEAQGSPGLFEVGNAIAGTSYDPATTDSAKLKEAAEAWRKWFDANR